MTDGSTGFLPGWLRDIGSMTALATVAYAVAMKDRPSLHIEMRDDPIGVDTEKVNFVVANNNSTRPIRVLKAWCFPRVFMLVPRSTARKTIAAVMRGRLNEIVAADGRAEFNLIDDPRKPFIPPINRVLIVVAWQSLAGLSTPRSPVIKLVSIKDLNEMTSGWAYPAGPGGRKEVTSTDR